MIIRKLQLQEVKQLHKLLTIKYGPAKAESRALLIEDIHLHNGYIVGAFAAQQLVGFAALDCQYISGFRVRLAELIMPSNQESVQVQLLETINLKAQALEAEALYLCANNEERELQFYHQQGFVKATPVDSYLEQLYEEEIHLARSLKK